MATPCYASTEWEGLGQAILCFRPKRKTTKQIALQQIECYLSAVYIGEYGERKEEVHQAENESDLKPPAVPAEVWSAWEEYWKNWKDVLIPLSWTHKYRDYCSPEYVAWHDSYLEDYPDMLPLITNELGENELGQDISKYAETQEGMERETGPSDKEYECKEPEQSKVNTGASMPSLSTIDSQSTSESCLTEANGNDVETCQHFCEVEIVKSGVLGRKPQEKTDDEDNTSVSTKEKSTEFRKVLDELYEKHYKSRYFVHLRSFLHTYGIEQHPEIELFCEKKAGISFILPSPSESCNGVPDIEDEFNGVVKDERNPLGDQSEELSQVNSQPVTGHEESNAQDIIEIKSCSNHAVDVDHNKTVQSKPTGNTEKQKHVEIVEEKFEEHITNGLTKKRVKDTLCVLMGESGTTNGTEELNMELQEANEMEAEEYTKVEEDTSSSSSSSSLNVECLQAAAESAGTQGSVASSKTEWKTTKKKQRSAGVQDTSEIGQERRVNNVAQMVMETLPASQEQLDAPMEHIMTIIPPPIPEYHEDSDEEGDTFRYYLDCMDESEKYHAQKRQRMLEKQALKEAPQEDSSHYSKIKTACQATVKKAVEYIQNMFLPLTLLHIVNVARPGAAAIEYESSVTEEVPGEREELLYKFDSFVFDARESIKYCLWNLGVFCYASWKNAVMPLGRRHLVNVVFHNTLEIGYQFPAVVFGVRWLPDHNASLIVHGKNIMQAKRQLQRWLAIQNQDLSPEATVELRGLVMNRVKRKDDPRTLHQVYQKAVQEGAVTEGGCPRLTFETLDMVQDVMAGTDGDSEGPDVDWQRGKVVFNTNGFSHVTEKNTNDEKKETDLWQKIISGCNKVTFIEKEDNMPTHLPQEMQKYWAQRHRFFLRYDEGIKLDTESWYSVTPELMAAHQARRCKCDVVVDAMCGAGGNAIQLAKTCSHVIAIDKDPNKIALARHNAGVYGVAHRIDFRVGNFFKMASSLKADVVFLSPPWGGTEYLKEDVYNVYRLGNTMNCAHLLRTARIITPNVALYLPRNSNLYQVIGLAGLGGVVDIEAMYMGFKKKAFTAYFGDLATQTGQT